MTTPTAQPVVALVDDDPMVRSAIASLLRAAGYGIETFASAEEFLQVARQEELSCLVLDMRLPGMSGLELLQHLRAGGSCIQTLCISGQADTGGRMRALAAGARTILNKPFDPENLLSLVQSICEENGGADMEQMREHHREARRR